MGSVGGEDGLLELLVEVLGSFVEADDSCDADTAAFEVGDAASYPVGADADGREVVHARFGAEVVDLGLCCVELEEGVVDGAGDGVREGIGGARAGFDCGDGRGDYAGPFVVGVAGCWSHCCGSGRMVGLLEGCAVGLDGSGRDEVIGPTVVSVRTVWETSLLV